SVTREKARVVTRLVRRGGCTFGGYIVSEIVSKLMMKRLFDIVVAAFLILILSPLFLILADLVGLTLGSPVFFKQVRPGLHARPFTMYKFRTMTNARDEQGRLLPD